MLRLACCLGVERGVEICAPVHDAVLICAPIERLDFDISTMRGAMAEASRAERDLAAVRACSMSSRKSRNACIGAPMID